MSYIFTYFVFDVSLVPVEDVVHSGAYSSGKGWNRKGWKERPQRLRNHLQGNKGLNWSNLALRQDKQCRQAGALRFTNNKWLMKSIIGQTYSNTSCNIPILHQFVSPAFHRPERVYWNVIIFEVFLSMYLSRCFLNTPKLSVATTSSSKMFFSLEERYPHVYLNLLLSFDLMLLCSYTEKVWEVIYYMLSPCYSWFYRTLSYHRIRNQGLQLHCEGFGLDIKGKKIFLLVNPMRWV